MSVIKLAANAVKARLIGAPREAKLRVSDLLSYYVEGYEHTDTYKRGSWDGRSSFFEFRDGTFPAGFAPAVASDLTRAGYTVQLIRKRPPPALGPDFGDAYAAVNPFPYDPKYDYQIETVRRLEKHGQIIAQVATGGGKSMIARTAAKRLMRPTLFLTTRSVLMYQMKTGFEEAGFRVGVMGDSEFRPVRGVNVAMIQTIAAKLKPVMNPAGRLDAKGNLRPWPEEQMRESEKVQKLLQLFEFAILEEAHEAGGNSYFDVMNALVNCHYRMALTATPFMRPDAEANMRLMAVSGQIGIRVTEKMLIDRGILARPVFKFARFPKDKNVRPSHSWQKAYARGIVQHEGRNEAIIWETTRAVKHGLSTMILVQRKDHGRWLKDELKARGVRADFIFGEHGQDRRQVALNKLRDGEIDVLIGSTILDVGVDVPAVGMVVLAGGGKAEVALRQRIGRGLRAKKDGPNVCFVLDFFDTENRYLRDHRKTRAAIIDGTEGFAENVLGENEDFPYEIFQPAAA